MYVLTCVLCMRVYVCVCVCEYVYVCVCLCVYCFLWGSGLRQVFTQVVKSFLTCRLIWVKEKCPTYFTPCFEDSFLVRSSVNTEWYARGWPWCKRNTTTSLKPRSICFEFFVTPEHWHLYPSPSLRIVPDWLPVQTSSFWPLKSCGGAGRIFTFWGMLSG